MSGVLKKVYKGGFHPCSKKGIVIRDVVGRFVLGRENNLLFFDVLHGHEVLNQMADRTEKDIHHI